MVYPGIFAYNGRQDIDDIHLGEISYDPTTPAFIVLDICDIKPVSF